MAINVNELDAREQKVAQHGTVLDTQQTRCCIVGGGPAGAVLAYILARAGIDVTLLEKHADFDRDFRGDTLHPATMEVMDQLGLAERLLQLRHSELGFVRMVADDTALEISFKHLHTKFPYITFMPQVEFLNFLTEEAKKFPCFHLLMNADVKELVEENGMVVGVRFQSPDGWHEIRAGLTVAADGRFSKVRHLAGIAPIKRSQPLDVLWFRLPRKASDGEGVAGRIHKGSIFVMLDRDTEWQVAHVIPKGKYKEVQAAGLPALRRTLAEALPQLADRVDCLQDWRQMSLLAVESSICKQWYKPGLLLIGDAAHVISPVGGVGINYAVQDAVVTANLLTKPLREGTLAVADLARVQQEREGPTKLIQRVQNALQDRIVASALQNGKRFKLPFIVRLGLVRSMAARLIAFGPKRVRLTLED